MGSVKVLTTEEFKTLIHDFEAEETWKFRGTRPAVVDFYADWCGPCRALAPILEEVATEFAGKVDIYKVDTEATPEIASLFGIRGIPSILFVPMQGEPAMATGVMPKESFAKAFADIFQIT